MIEQQELTSNKEHMIGFMAEMGRKWGRIGMGRNVFQADGP